MEKKKRERKSKPWHVEMTDVELRGFYRVLGIQDICHFTSRDIGYYPFLLPGIFWSLSGILTF